MMLVAQHSGFQRSLFTSTQEKLIADMSVSADEMASWHSKEWLSFNPLTLAHYDEGERIEVQFMKGLAHSGLSDAMINDRVDQGHVRTHLETYKSEQKPGGEWISIIAVGGFRFEYHRRRRVREPHDLVG